MGSLRDHDDMACALVITGHMDGYALRQGGRVLATSRSIWSLEAERKRLERAAGYPALEAALSGLEAAHHELTRQAYQAGYRGEPGGVEQWSKAFLENGR